MRKNSSPRISFDANAGVPATARALEKFVEVASKFSANPASNNQEGRAAQAVIEKSKLQIAEAFGCATNELFFTSGATEANNLAIHGLISDLEQQFGQKPILISSKAEHPSCLAYLRVLQQRGYKLELLALDPHARFDVNDYAFNDDHCYLIVGQWANNETGAIQNIAACAAIAGDADNIRWHCDAVQGIGKTLFDDDLLVADSFSISGHKFGAPKGCGLLRLKSPSACSPLFFGGGQQDSVRPGTESPALVASLTVALLDAIAAQGDFQKSCLLRKKVLLDALEGHEFSFVVNSPRENCLANTLSISFSDIDGRMILPALDIEKISLSAGSACASGAALASSVLLASNVSEKMAQASIRVSFMESYPDHDVEHELLRLANTINHLYKVAKP
jgi:cysteine desulfurase